MAQVRRIYLRTASLVQGPSSKSAYFSKTKIHSVDFAIVELKHDPAHTHKAHTPTQSTRHRKKYCQVFGQPTGCGFPVISNLGKMLVKNCGMYEYARFLYMKYNFPSGQPDLTSKAHFCKNVFFLGSSRFYTRFQKHLGPSSANLSSHSEPRPRIFK